ncbi:hypothetical protein K0M31_007321, partial [Melipona bicolor]
IIIFEDTKKVLISFKTHHQLVHPTDEITEPSLFASDKTTSLRCESAEKTERYSETRSVNAKIGYRSEID